MDQQKIGIFLKDLRKEKNLTQEQLAEHFGVSRRSVSRWETGSALPDLSVLMELADFYEVDLRALLEGRRDPIDQVDLKDTVRKVAEISQSEKARIKANMHLLFIGGLVAALLYMVLYFTGLENNFIGGLCQGITTGMMVVGIIMTSKNTEALQKLKWKLLHKN